MDAVEEALAVGLARFPAIRLGPSELADHVRAQNIEEPTLRRRACDIYLAAAGAKGDHEALRVLERHHLRRVHVYLQSLRLNADLIEEACQLLRIRMLVGPPPRIATYNGRAPLAKWLRTAATRIALDLWRTARRRHRLALYYACSHPSPVYANLEQELEKVRGLPAFQAALDATLHELRPQEQTLLKRYYLDGLSIDLLAPLYAVHRGTVARRLQALRRVLTRDVRKRVVRQLRTSTPECFEDLVEAVRSELEVPPLRLAEGS